LAWLYYNNPELATKTRAFLGDAFGDSKTTAAVLSAVFALGTLVVGLHQARASRIAAHAAMLTAKSSGNRDVASMRIKWVEKLREVLSEYHSILMSVEKFTDEGLTSGGD